MRSYASTYRALDERGASILIALLFFLVCALVGGVVLTAASVGTGQLVDYEKSQQAYYSTTSAAELLRESASVRTTERRLRVLACRWER